MKRILINQNDAGQRLDKFLQKSLPVLPASLMQKYIRKKRVKLNGKRSQNNYILQQGDVLELFINDEFLKPQEHKLFLRCKLPLEVVFEDENILVVNKKPGVLVHEDEHEKINTLINAILKYLWEGKKYDPDQENSFTPALCNRIDRNTQGLVIAAKNAQALRIVNAKLKSHEIEKRYVCLVHGRLEPKEAVLVAYLKKDPKLNQVAVSLLPKPGYKQIKTGYKVLKSSQKVSLVEVELFTGRTHQIRAQFAKMGHPLVGDNKYGNAAKNREFGVWHQALVAVSITFKFRLDAGILNYLNGRTVKLGQESFASFLDYV